MFTPALFPAEAVLTVPGPRLELAGNSWIFRLPRELRPLNDTLWGHWRTGQRERQAWELELEGAIAAFLCVRAIEGFAPGESHAMRQLRRAKELRERRQVRVVRFVPHTRNLLRDDESVASCAKHLIDAMKRVGLIVDDSRDWMTRVPPEQHVAGDGAFTTVVQLDRPDVRGSWRS